MKERPILFSGPMVNAILSDEKTQTRRVVTPQPKPFVQSTPDRHSPKHSQPYLDAYCGEAKTYENPRGMGRDWCWWTRDDRPGATVARCPYGFPGCRLWVRETWAEFPSDGDWIYRADHVEDLTDKLRWQPSIFMPRRASRLTLEVTEVRVQRLHEISQEDIEAEGVIPACERAKCTCSRDMFRPIWDRLNGKRAPWLSNPWVWAITFRRTKCD